jgi:hypothetical protein
MAGAKYLEDEFFLVERLAQLIFQIEPVDRRFGHFLCVKQVSIAAHLGFFEGGLGVREQPFRPAAAGAIFFLFVKYLHGHNLENTRPADRAPIRMDLNHMGI